MNLLVQAFACVLLASTVLATRYTYREHSIETCAGPVGVLKNVTFLRDCPEKTVYLKPELRDGRYVIAQSEDEFKWSIARAHIGFGSGVNLGNYEFANFTWYYGFNIRFCEDDNCLYWDLTDNGIELKEREGRTKWTFPNYGFKIFAKHVPKYIYELGDFQGNYADALYQIKAMSIDDVNIDSATYAMSEAGQITDSGSPYNFIIKPRMTSYQLLFL